MKEEKVIYVNPVPRASVQGWDRASYTTYKKGSNEVVSTSRIGTTKAFGKDGAAYEQLMFPIDFTANKVITTLDEVIDNPLYELTIEEVRQTYKVGGAWTDDMLDKIIKSQTIQRQTLYEIQDNTNPGYYTDDVAGETIFQGFRSLSKEKDNNVKPNYLQKFMFRLDDRGNRISDATPKGKLAQRLMLVSRCVAPNKQSINSAYHRWYISEENEAEHERVKKQTVVNRATFNFVYLQDEHPAIDLYKIARLLKQDSGRSLVSVDTKTSTVIDRLNKFITGKSKHQIDNVKAFNQLFNLLKEKEGKQKIDIMFLIQQAIDVSVMSIIDGYYVWHSMKEQPNKYKFNSYDRMIALFMKSKKEYNPKDTDVSNWYQELFEEVGKTGAKLI